MVEGHKRNAAADFIIYISGKINNFVSYEYIITLTSSKS